MTCWQGPDESSESFDVVRLQEDLADHGDLLRGEIEHSIHHWIYGWVEGWHLRPIDWAVAEGINFGGPSGSLVRTNGVSHERGLGGKNWTSSGNERRPTSGKICELIFTHFPPIFDLSLELNLRVNLRLKRSGFAIA